MHRRDVMHMLLAATGGSILSRCSGAAPRAIAPGIQLYTVRTLMEKDAAGTLDALARIGYREVEFAGLHGMSAEAARGTLDRLGLVSPASHIALEELDRDAEAVFARSTTLGNRYVVVPWLSPERRRTIADYEAVADALNRHGRAAQDARLQLAYHNHDFELQAIGEVVPYHVLLERTDPSLVAMELDLFWLAKGGGDPLAYFARHPGRFAMVHVKDMARDGTMVDVGSGTLDFRRVFADAERAGLRHAFVEHDSPADPLASARASHAAMVRLLS